MSLFGKLSMAIVRRVLEDGANPHAAIDQVFHGEEEPSPEDWAAAEAEMQASSQRYGELAHQHMDVALHQAMQPGGIVDFDRQNQTRTAAEQARRKRLGLPPTLYGLEAPDV